MGVSFVIDETGLHMIDSDEPSLRPSRPERGCSILKDCSDYVAVDLETTGLSPIYNEIIEIGAVRVRNGQPVEKYQSLVQPFCLDDFDEYITELTGITPAMLAEAPKLDDVLPAALSFIGNDIIVGHNTSFDVNFLYDAAADLQLGPVSNDYIDTMRLSRKLFPDMVNHKLRTLVQEFGIANSTEHRALGDAQVTVQCYEYIKAYTTSQNLWDFVMKPRPHKKVRAADITAHDDANAHSDFLAGQTIVFTGTLERMLRSEAMQIVADLGGINGDTVTKSTNYLVLGNNDYCKSIKDGKSNKQKKAEKYILAGADLQIISESVFYDMLENEYQLELSATEDTPTASKPTNILEQIEQALPSEYLNNCKFSIEPLKLKLKDDFFKNVPCSNLCAALPSSMYFPNGVTITVCRILNDCAYFPSLGEQGIIHFSSNNFVERFAAAFSSTLEQNVSVSTFGCCHKYVACSDARHCVHANPFYAVGCTYKKSLDAGRIFYGSNKNV